MLHRGGCNMKEDVSAGLTRKKKKKKEKNKEIFA